MARNIVFEAQSPLQVGDKWVCRCGLSKNWQGTDPQPWCDGSHKHTRTEEAGKAYEYKEDGTRVEVS
jgi:CDGSH-type Zn-finger protein